MPEGNRIPKVRLGVVREDDREIPVAVRAGVSAGSAAEENHGDGVRVLHEKGDRAFESTQFDQRRLNRAPTVQFDAVNVHGFAPGLKAGWDARRFGS